MHKSVKWNEKWNHPVKYLDWNFHFHSSKGENKFEFMSGHKTTVKCNLLANHGVTQLDIRIYFNGS